MQTRMAARILTLYTRDGCHLCEDMQAIVAPLARQYGYALERVDIAGVSELEARFGEEIPVLFIDGRKAFKFRVTERELRKQLARKER